VQRLLALPSLGVVPGFVIDAVRTENRPVLELTDSVHEERSDLVPVEEEEGPGELIREQRDLITLDCPTAVASESYRTIRTALMLSSADHPPKVILVTSAKKGEGKTTLATNLAVAMAQAGNRVLLLDADFRRPTQHKIFELDKSIGLSSMLAGEADLQQAIHETPINGLHVLPCGPIPANPSEILNSQMFADLLEQLAERYDHVLLDSPPVVPVTDSRILAASCGATLLALRAEKTTRRTATHAKDVLRGVGARILGVVVNDVPRRRGIYGYYYSDSELYQYGYGRRRSAAGGGNGSGESGAVPPVVVSSSGKQ
jgi:capsular exopolysaccharide synthesis family protein